MKEKYSCIIIDDDKTFIQILENYISQVPKLVLAGKFSEPLTGMEAVSKMPYIDFLFIDIKMEVSGIDIARKLRHHVKFLIFITAYKSFAIDAFSVNCDHFLLKPVSFIDFLTSLNGVLARNHVPSS